MYEQIVIVGNVGRAAEMRYTPSGTAVTTFSVAVNHRYPAADGQPQERTKWYRVTTWRRLAEVCGQYVQKGMRVLVVGEIDASAWLDRDEAPRANLELTAREVKFLNYAASESSGAAQAADEAAGYEDREFGELPF